MTILKMTDLSLKGKRVLIREDLNVPMKEGEITSDARIQAVLPTLKLALDQKAAVMVMSHLGRPTPGSFDPMLSLEPIAQHLSKLLKTPVRFESNWIDGVDINPGEIVLFENVRFNEGEADNDEALSKKMAQLCDIFVMDAFATAHRAESSTEGIAKFAKIACAGPLLIKEIEALDAVMTKPKRPLLAIVGGAKVSTKLKLLESLAENVDILMVGGGIANTFLAAKGYVVGASLYEPDLIDEAERIMNLMEEKGHAVPLPVDVVVAEKMTDVAESYDEPIGQVSDDEKIFDIGPETTAMYVDIIKTAKTILWNGPVGAFEIQQFSHGTKAIAKAIAENKGVSMAGGGDTLAAIEKYKLEDKISYISTGGGAFLAYLEGKGLPAIEALKTHVGTQK